MKAKVLIVVISTFVAFPSMGWAKPDEYHACQAGYEYEHISSKKYKKTEHTHDHNNPSTEADSITFAVEVTQSATANVQTSAIFNAMAAKVGISAEVGWGITRSKKVKINWKIPPQSHWKLIAGSQWISAIGEERYINSRCKYTSSKSVTGTWTNSYWSDKVKVK